jgi:hypothetical protein
MLASTKHTLRPPIGQLTSARRLAASCTPALVARTTTIQEHLLINNEDFGGMSILLLGDFGQLTPVGASPLYCTKKHKTDNSDHINSQRLYRLFNQTICKPRAPCMVTSIIRQPISPPLHVYKLRSRTSQSRTRHFTIHLTTHFVSCSQLLTPSLLM